MVLGLLPFALIAKSRASQKDALPPHLVLDMDKQSKFKGQRASVMFADGRSMRPEIAGTVAQEDLTISGQTMNEVEGTRPIALKGADASMQLDSPTTYAAVMLGRIRPAAMTDDEFNKVTSPNKNDQEINADKTFYVRRVPGAFDISSDFLRRGQERFTIYCSPCHGESGYGDGPVAGRALSLQKVPDAINGWAAPQNLHDAKIAGRPDGHLFNTITNGVRNMPAYDKQITIEDRWAIVAYVRALERSQAAKPTDPGAQNP